MSYYITESGEKFDIPLDEYDLSGYRITSIFISDDKDCIWCDNNLLTELIIPEGVTNIACEKNKITSLNLPFSVEVIWCDMMDKLEEQYKKNIDIYIYQKG